jgi:exosortase A-associated hydrolase 2
MSEVPFFFPSAGFDLFGVMHAPQAARRSTAFLFCPPFGEEMLWTRLVYVNFARELARRGYPVLRFDYRGTGDSDGDFEDSTVETCLSDIRCALGVLAEKSGPASATALLGVRFGATLAALTAEAVPEVRRLVLWSPILNGAAYMQELLRVNLTTQLALYKEVRQNREALVQAMAEGRPANVDGYEITGAMFEQASSIDLLAGPKRSAANCLVAQISPSPQPTLQKELSALCSLYQAGHGLVAVEEPFWKEIRTVYARAPRLYEGTLSWLEQGENEV